MSIDDRRCDELPRPWFFDLRQVSCLSLAIECNQELHSSEFGSHGSYWREKYFLPCLLLPPDLRAARRQLLPPPIRTCAGQLSLRGRAVGFPLSLPAPDKPK